MIDYKGKIIVIAGPTASGKSDIAIKLAKKINGYIINGDSRQVYKYLNIGTAKPVFDKQISSDTYILDGIRHYLYDFVDPKENFTLFDYQLSVKKILEKENGIPILVGGSGLYIDSVVFNYVLTQNDIFDSTLQSKSIEELKNLAKAYLNDMNESDRENKHRLIRAIQREGVNQKKGDKLNYLYFVLDTQKEILKERVRKRIEKMFDNGLLEENINLLKKGYTYNDKGMNSIGYIEFKEYFEKKISLEDVKEKIYSNTLSYIKRQKTWFRRNKESKWINDEKDIYYTASNFILKE
ncbi:MAG: tRNA dimethylallyltransferase [candidate division WS6 bacterium GW2011_GWE1_34_7]|uniref:tRNA dimethylallyltransferase n=1 Tax=candidate division WS6 bacterium GW2011_GWE1_34_7 TaxID=1619093 RepID=A0A0G0B7Q0_9BACT|nr:MAG: tRNA dimethylallyltransferase [candidate division WS6 bacterium GW2011_GWE1_34_7]